MRGVVFQLRGDSNHFWVIIAEQGAKVLAVNITGAANCPDSPCIFQKGEHEILLKESAVFYRKAMEFDANKLRQELILDVSIRRLSDFPEALLQRIEEGAFKSDELTARLLRYLQ